MKRLIIAFVLFLSVFAAEATVYRAGFKGGYINSYDANNYTTVSIADTGVFASVEAGGVKASSNTQKTYPPIWVDNRTWCYHGQMYFDGGTYYFAEAIDDAAFVKVDGTQVLKDATWNNVGVSSAVAPAAGWHDVEIRLANGTGGAGVPYDTTKDANGRLCGFGLAHYETTPAAAPSGMSNFLFVVSTNANCLMRCVESISYITLNSISKTEGGYSFNITSLAPSPASVVVYAGDTAGAADSQSGWALNSGSVAFAANETKEIEVVGTFAVPPYFIVNLAGKGTTLAEGVDVDFWEWSDVKKCTMEPTVSVALSAVTASSGSFAVTLGYDKVVSGMEAPAIALKAYCGGADAGAVPTGWDREVDFGVDNVAGTASRVLSEMAANTNIYVRFAAKTPESDWIWSQCLFFSTGGVSLNTVTTQIYENDLRMKSFVVSRPSGTEAEELVVYLSYSENAAGRVSALPPSVTLAAGVLAQTNTFSTVDNAMTDGDQDLTIEISENSTYLRGNPNSATIRIIDDDSLIPTVCVWTGSANDFKWETGANWDGGVAPRPVDVAKFSTVGIPTDASIAISSGVYIARLDLEATVPFSLTENGGMLTLGGISRSETSVGNQTISAPLTVFAPADGKCVLDIDGAGSLRFNSNISQIGTVELWKVGVGWIDFCKATNSWNGTLTVREGAGRASAYHSYKGTLIAGGGDSEARFEFTVLNAPNGVTSKAYRNGYIYVKHGVSGEAKTYYVYDGGRIKTDSIYWLNGYLTGGTIEGGTWWSGGYAQSINSYASEVVSKLTANVQIGGYYDAEINTQRGTAPVDLLLAGALTECGSSHTLFKKGNGIVKSTQNCAFKCHFALQGGKWFVDNPGEYGLGLQETTVSTGATLGGTGCVGMKDVKSTATVTLNNGTADKYATLEAGTVDPDTGGHVYGTFTLGRASAHNKVTLGTYSRVRVGLGEKATGGVMSPADSLFVYGNLEIGANCTLDLVTNTATNLAKLAAGTYTLVKADAITGTFAQILSPRTSWHVQYVTEGGVVTRIDYVVPEHGFFLIVK